MYPQSFHDYTGSLTLLCFIITSQACNDDITTYDPSQCVGGWNPQSLLEFRKARIVLQGVKFKRNKNRCKCLSYTNLRLISVIEMNLLASGKLRIGGRNIVIFVGQSEK